MLAQWMISWGKPRKTMTRAKFTLGLLLMLPASTVGAGPLPSTSGTGDQSRITAAAASPEAAVQGTWSGTFRSKHTHIAPFTLTLVINPDMHGHLINKSGLTSYCLLRDVDLHVIVNGSNAALAGLHARSVYPWPRFRRSFYQRPHAPKALSVAHTG